MMCILDVAQGARRKEETSLSSTLTPEVPILLHSSEPCVHLYMCSYLSLPLPFSIQARARPCGPVPPPSPPLTHSDLMILANEQPNLQNSANLPRGNPDTLLSFPMQSSVSSVLSARHAVRRRKNRARRM